MQYLEKNNTLTSIVNWCKVGHVETNIEGNSWLPFIATEIVLNTNVPNEDCTQVPN